MYAFTLPQPLMDPYTVLHHHPFTSPVSGTTPYLGQGTPQLGQGTPYLGQDTSYWGQGPPYLGQGLNLGTAPGLGLETGPVTKETTCPPPPVGFVDPMLHVLMPFYGGCVAEPAGLPGAPNTMFAMPLAPQPLPKLEKRLNGLNYTPGSLYEGYVKRYNPVRGFGFLTATHQVFSATDAALGGSTTTVKELERSTTEAPDLNGISTESSPEISFMPNEMDPGAAGDGRPTDTLSTSLLKVGTCMQLEPKPHSLLEEMPPDASSTSFPSADSTTSASTKSVRSYTCVPIKLGDIFVHQSYVEMHGFRTLPVRGRVRFQVSYMEGQSSYQAINVELLPQVVPLDLDLTNIIASDIPDSKNNLSES
ncbi:unnamed protein product [Phytomonas sp. Hart1]|nr:unnamed protein product [Phytomonas sp. Hart1]|eukprot:CCW69821.1 unnamed protein product [Phytomonas sp. isolate Hart1]